jgi:hypothetical protein
MLTDAYESIGKEIDAKVIPVGRAWQRFLAVHDAPVLYDKDGSHPTPAGSYLAASLFVATLLGRGPRTGDGAAAAGLTPAEAKLLGQAAADVLR